MYKIWDVKYIRERERERGRVGWKRSRDRLAKEDRWWLEDKLDTRSNVCTRALFLDRNSREYRITILWQCRWFTTCVTLDFSTRRTRYVLSHSKSPIVHRTPVSTSRLNSRDQSDRYFRHFRSRASKLSDAMWIYLNLRECERSIFDRDLSLTETFNLKSFERNFKNVQQSLK